MPTCALDAIATAADCADKGGLLKVFWIPESDVDWSATTVTDNVISAFTVTGTWNELSFTRKNGRLDATYTDDNGFYEIALLNLTFSGNDASKSLSLEKALSCCKIVAIVYSNNGIGRMIGKEYVNGEWVDTLENVKIGRHLDTTGGFGAADDKARDEIDITGEQSIPPLYTTVTSSSLNA